MKKRLLLPALLTAAVSSAAFAQAAETGFVGAVKNGVFETCPALVLGAVKVDDPALQKLGYARLPTDVEQRLVHSKFGKPEAVRRMVGADSIMLAVYPAGSICSVSFGGAERISGYDAIKARVAAEPGFFQPDPDFSGPQGRLRFESYQYRVSGQGSFRLSIARPADADADANAMVMATITLIKD